MTPYEMCAEWETEFTDTEKVPDFSGPTLEEIFDENPCLLEIGPLSLTKLVYGTWLESQPPTEDMTPEQCACFDAIVYARNEVANNFMKYFNIQPKHGGH